MLREAQGEKSMPETVIGTYRIDRKSNEPIEIIEFLLRDVPLEFAKIPPIHLGWTGCFNIRVEIKDGDKKDHCDISIRFQN